MAETQRTDALFCSVLCKHRAYKAFLRCERAADKAGRACACCGGPIPATRRADAQFCGQRCMQRAAYQRDKAAAAMAGHVRRRGMRDDGHAARIIEAIRQHPDASNRAIARLVGGAPSTVRAVRRGNREAGKAV